MECYDFGYSGSADIIGGLLWPKIVSNTDYYYDIEESKWSRRTVRRCESSARKVSVTSTCGSSGDVTLGTCKSEHCDDALSKSEVGGC